MATVTRAMIDPTERSIPPEMMISVMPRAAEPTIAVWRAMVSRLFEDQKLSGPMIANSEKISTRPASGPSVCVRDENRFMIFNLNLLRQA